MLAIPLLACAVPAAAEPGYSLSLATDDRYRGQTTSDGRPVATGTISYDDASGLYLGGSVTFSPTRDNGIRPIRWVQYGGYAHRLPSGLALDIGVTNRIYSRDVTLEYARAFVQGYVGVIGRNVSARLYYAPDYDGANGAAVYGEVDALLFDRENWSVTGHVGASMQGESRREAAHGPEFDLRLATTRRLGRLGLTASLVGTAPERRGDRWRGALVLAGTRAF